MINYIKRSEIDDDKYNLCIDKSFQSKIFAFSWYLDIVVDEWDALVIRDYEAVMPIPWRKKYGIKYVYPPFWILELGIFSLTKNEIVDDFLKQLFSKYKFVELRMNSFNKILNRKYIQKNQFQTISLGNEYKNLFKNYRKDRKKDLNKAKRFNLIEKWNDNPENLIHLFRKNVGKRTHNILEKDYQKLYAIIDSCVNKSFGEVLSIYDESEKLVASGFFLKHNKEITILISSTDFENRNNGANTFLIERAICKYQKKYNCFNFGGSSMKSIANYFLSFGAENQQYDSIKRRLL